MQIAHVPVGQFWPSSVLFPSLTWRSSVPRPSLCLSCQLVPAYSCFVTVTMLLTFEIAHIITPFHNVIKSSHLQMWYTNCVYCSSVYLVHEAAGHNHQYPSLLSHQCRHCSQKWFSCDGSCHVAGRTQNFSKFYAKFQQVVRHFRKCHTGAKYGLAHSNSSGSSSSALDQSLLDQCLKLHTSAVGDVPQDSILESIPLSPDTDCHQDSPSEDNSNPYDTLIHDNGIGGESFPIVHSVTRDGDELVESEDDDLHYQTPPVLIESETTTQKFQRHMVDGNALAAASVLVSRAAFGTSNPTSTVLPIPNILFFLYLARLVIATGSLQLCHLSRVLSFLVPYAETIEKSWAPIPCTVSGFRSSFLNVSNSNSLVSILPIPTPETLPDGHVYTPLQTILRHALTMKTFDPVETNDPKWRSIASSDIFCSFLSNIEEPQRQAIVPLTQLAVGIILWTDGWDTSTGCKSNRSSMHTGTITLFCTGRYQRGGGNCYLP